MKLALGTVQFGLPYGVANRAGQVAETEAAAILAYARTSGIDTIDTAIGYGDSEAILGRIGLGGFRVITKLPPVPDDLADVADWVEAQIAGSLARLGVTRLAGVLLHRPEQLLEPKGARLADALRGLKQHGLAEKVGMSIYAPDQLADLLDAGPVDLIQAPFNLIDRRLAASGLLDRLKARGIEIHVRSAFLQGLLLMSRGDRPRMFDRWSALRRWDDWREAHPAVSPAAVCIGFPQSCAAIDRVVVGVDSLTQLESLASAARAPVTGGWPDISSTDESLINPALWSKS